MANTNATPDHNAGTLPAPQRGLKAALGRDRWQRWWQAQGREVTRQALALVCIGGLTAFGWGSLQAWSVYRQKQHLQTELEQQGPALARWMAEPFDQLKPVAEDLQLQAALQTPLGLAGPAAERALQRWEGLAEQSDVVLYDANTGRTLPLGLSQVPSAELLRRVADLPAVPQRLIAAGFRNGMLTYVVPIPTTLAQRVYLILTLSVRQRATEWQQRPSPDNAMLALRLPHLEQPIVWRQDEPLRFEAVQGGTQPQPLQATMPLATLPDVQALLIQEGPLPLVGWLPQLLVLLWGLAASLAVLWPHTAPMRRRLAGPMQRLVVGPWQKAMLGFAAISRRVVKERAATQTPSWDAAETELAGPGDYSASDFRNSTKANPYRNRPKLKPRPPEVSVQAVAGFHNPAATAPLLPSDLEIMMKRVQRCMRQGMVELMYQPIYNCKTNDVDANEILARLRDEEGLLSPAQFLPVLQQMGELAALDSLVFTRLIDEHFAAGKRPPVLLSINVSGTSLDDLTYLRDVATRGEGILKRLIFEVRSSEVVRDPKALQLLKALQRQGGKVAVDYFGGGKAMLQATKALGIDMLKIDMMAFYKTKDLKREFAEVCDEALRLGLPVVVEKIEDAEMDALARRVGAQMLQGYGLGKPASSLATLPLSARF